MVNISLKCFFFKRIFFAVGNDNIWCISPMRGGHDVMAAWQMWLVLMHSCLLSNKSQGRKIIIYSVSNEPFLIKYGILELNIKYSITCFIFYIENLNEWNHWISLRRAISWSSFLFLMKHWFISLYYFYLHMFSKNFLFMFRPRICILYMLYKYLFRHIRGLFVS